VRVDEEALGADVPPQDRPHDSDSVRALIAGVRPAFELIDDRGADYAALDAFTLIADNAWCRSVVLGAPIAGREAQDLDALAGVIEQPGYAPERIVTGAAAPLASLAWVLNHASAAGQTVGRGEHVITGSAARTRFPKAGERLSYQLDGLTEVELDVV